MKLLLLPVRSSIEEITTTTAVRGSIIFMQDGRHIFLAGDTLPNDEIDDLFQQLHQIQPPPSLIQHILTSVAKLPKPQPVEQESEIDELDTLIVKKDMLPPS